MKTPSIVRDIMDHRAALAAARRVLDDHYQQLAELMLPSRADFTVERTPGEKKTTEIFDGVPLLARRGLAGAIDGLLKPKTSKWFRAKLPDDDRYAEDPEVRAWLEDCNKRMWTAKYNPKARFIQRSGEVDNDLVTFGLGCLWLGESKDRRHLSYRSHHLKHVFIAENADGNVDTIYVVLPLMPRQAEQLFGRDRLGPKVREALDSTSRQDRLKRFKFVECVRPRHDRDPRSLANTDMPYSSVVICEDDEQLIDESGYHEFPYIVPRWDTTAGQVYPDSPGMIALGDARTLQNQAKTILSAGHMKVRPPLAAPNEGIIGPVRAFPGGMTIYDAKLASSLGRNPVFPIETGGNIPIGREMQRDTREQVWSAFFRNVLQLPGADGPKMTATEILERKDEFIRTIGPVFGKLESDYAAADVERQFMIMYRGGGFRPEPEVLRGREVIFEFASPVTQARRQIEAAALGRAFEVIAPLAQAQPEILQNFDGDAIVRDLPDTFGLPEKWLRDKNAVEQMRGAQQQAATVQELLAGGGQAADIVQKLGRIPGAPGGTGTAEAA